MMHWPMVASSRVSTSFVDGVESELFPHWSAFRERIQLERRIRPVA